MDLVLSADRWRMTDDKTGEVREGVSLHYLTDYREETDNSVGFKPMKVGASDAAFAEIKRGGAPGLYDLALKSRPGKDGVPTFQIVGAKLINRLDLFPKD